MITDSVAQKLEERGLWRRAATRWAEFFFTQKRTLNARKLPDVGRYASVKTRRMPEQLVTFGDVKKAAYRTLKRWGLIRRMNGKIYSFSDAGDDLALS